jgi:hypothetical protein
MGSQGLNQMKYPTTLAASTLIILFSEMLKLSKVFFFQITKFCEGKY